MKRRIAITLDEDKFKRLYTEVKHGVARNVSDRVNELLQYGWHYEHEKVKVIGGTQ